MFCCLFVTAGLYAQSEGEFAALAREVQEKWRVPALSLTVVKDGEVVFAQGFGKLSASEDAPRADANTQFVNASTSKAFTSALMGILVDRSYIRWQDTVARHLSDFRLYDDWITQNYLVQDIMNHKIGFSAYALDEMPALGYKRDELYEMFRFIKPTYSYRTTYAYCNSPFIIAAKIIEKYTGLTWDDAVAEYIFKPLEMTGTSTGKYAYPDSDRLACGHRLIRKDDGSLKIEPRTDREESFDWCSAVAPAAFVVSTANDMGHWMQMLLNRGVYKGRRILSEETLDFIFKPQTICACDDSEALLYAQGWRVEYGPQGKLIHHTGLASGYTALVCLAPDLNLGVTVMMNQGSTNTPHYAIVRQIIDMYRGKESHWPDTLFARYMQPSAPRRHKTEKPKQPALPLEAYAGTYHKEVFGDARVSVREGKLHFKLRLADGYMRHITGNTFEVDARSETIPVTFIMGPGGKAAGFTLDLDNDVGAFSRLVY